MRASRVAGLAVGAAAALALLALLRAALPPDRAGPQPATAPSLEVEEAVDVEALHALGYVDEASDVPAGAPVGVLEHRAEGARGGIDYVTVAPSCASYIARPTGEVLRRWSHAPCDRWENSILTSEGHVLAVHARPMPAEASLETILRDSTSLLKLDWDGELLWEKKLPVHHDVGLTPDGNIAVLTRRLRIFPGIDPKIPVRDHGIAILSPEGELLEEVSLMEIMARSRGRYRPIRARMLGGAAKRSINALHANSLDWMGSDTLAARGDFYSKDHVLVTLRAQNAIWLVHWPSRTISWSWGHGEIHGPHDASVLPSGNVLLFDNGTRKRRSRVVELDPTRGEIVWQYKGHDFFSDSRSSAQRLPGGNILVAVSDSAEAFEVTPSGAIVWHFRNPELGPKGKPAAIVRIRNYPPAADLKPRAPSD